VPLFSGTPDVVYLVPRSERIAAAGDVKRTFQVKPLNSVVLMVKICSTTPVVLSLAFKTSTVVAYQQEGERRGCSTNHPLECTSLP
jgi:hypothetical protein